MKSKIFFLLFLGIILNFVFLNAIGAQEEGVVVHFFSTSSCPNCARQKLFMDDLEKKYSQLEIKKYILDVNANEVEIFTRLLDEYQVAEKERGYVPTTFIADRYWVGYATDSTTGKEMENYLIQLLEGEDGGGACPPELKPLAFMVFGKEFQLSEKNSLFSLALVLGLADGINPCMFSVLLMLVAYLLAISSDSKKALKAGLVFGFCVFLIYLGLMIGIYQSLCLFQENLIALIGPLKMGLGILLLLVGFWQFKDFFLKSEKISFSIPGFAKPILEKLIKRSTLPAVIILAIFSSLVELPCTFALPLSFSAVLANRGASPYFYMFLYNLFFVLPLFVIVVLIGFGFGRAEKIEAWREKSKKTMRLVSGLLLTLLALAFLFKVF